MGETRLVRIFLSSPGAVDAERKNARDFLFLELAGLFPNLLRLDVVSWDDPGGGATRDGRSTLQQALDRSLPMPGDCHFTVVLLGLTLGRPFTGTRPDGTPYLSSTEWVVENAVSADKPVLLYRPLLEAFFDWQTNFSGEAVAQWERVESLLARDAGDGGGSRSSHATYTSAQDLKERVRVDVWRVVSDLLRDEPLKREALAQAEVQPVHSPGAAEAPQPRAVSANSLFVCYRREETADAAGRLHDRLTSAFGANRIFMDIDSVPLGVDFVDHVAEQIAGCSAVVVMIGRQWATITDRQGRVRLQNDIDLVRMEIAAALRLRVPVIPVFVQGAEMPNASELPEDIRALARRNGIDLSATRWHADVERLVKELERVMRSQ